MIRKKVSLLVFMASITVNIAIAQEPNTGIVNQFENAIEESETFKQYKVIPITKLNLLVNNVKDSIRKSRNEISKLNSDIKSLNSKIEEVSNTVNSLNTSLAESEKANNTILFLGMSLKKTVYNILVWSIILALIAILAFSYLLFQRSNKVTQTTKKDLHKLSGEFESFKTKSHEKQVKLKRDLQTALNTLHEKGIKS